MNNSKLEDIRWHINRLCKLMPERPTDDEFKRIITRFNSLPKSLRDEDHLLSIVSEEAPQEGFYLTEGLDTSDVNLLLTQINNLLKE